VPGHEDIEGNKTADQMAKLGSESACEISVGITKKAVKEWTDAIKNTGSP
jgi:hypothetical protein